MTKEQSQFVEDGGQAIQAGRDVIIGVTQAQMMQIMAAMAGQLVAYTAEAEQTMAKRLEAFREELTAEFLKPGRADASAFRDPDFQSMLAEAQSGYGRTGDGAVKDTLVDIIARRSLQPSGSLRALSLNEAALRAPKLTKAEFAALTLVYFVRYTQRHNVASFPNFCAHVRDWLVVLARQTSPQNASFWHIEAQSCGRINSLGRRGLRDLLVHGYGGLLGKGFDRAQLDAQVPGDDKSVLDARLRPCLHNAEKLQFNALNKGVFSGFVETGLTKEQLESIWGVFENTMPSEAELKDMLAPYVPDVGVLFDLWSNSPLGQLELNSVGITIAHANAVRVVGFDAPLSTLIS